MSFSFSFFDLPPASLVSLPLATVFGFFAAGFGFFVVSMTFRSLQAANSAGQASLPTSFEPLRLSLRLVNFGTGFLSAAKSAASS